MLVLWPHEKVIDTHVWVATLVELSLSRGAKLANVLRGTGIFEPDLRLAEHKVSLMQLQKLVSNCLKQTNSGDLGFMLGRRLLSVNDSCFANLIPHCRNLNGVLRALVLYQGNLFPPAFIEVKRADQNHHLILNSALSGELRQFLFETLAAFLNQVFKSYAQSRPKLTFMFEHNRPQNIYQYEQNLGHQLDFGCHLNLLKIASQDLQIPLDDSSPLTRQRLLTLCQQAPQRRKLGVKHYLYRELSRNQIVNFEQAADLLQVSPATLKRRLQQAELRFQKVHDEVNKQQAIFQLLICNQNNETIAKNLHYSDTTNFRRAFKRWTGVTPQQIKLV